MTEATNELGLIERVRGHFHPSHGGHLLVHGEELIFRDLDLEVWCVAVVSAERVFVKFYGQAVGVAGEDLGRVCGGLNASGKWLGGEVMECNMREWLDIQFERVCSTDAA